MLKSPWEGCPCHFHEGGKQDHSRATQDVDNYDFKAEVLEL